MTVKPVPEGYGTVTPYLITTNGAGLLDFIVKAFGATEVHAMRDDAGQVRHAEFRIGDSHVMLGHGHDKAMPCMLHLYVPDVDAVYARAMAAGGVSVREPADQFYGDRSGGVRDPFGNEWWIATHVEDVSPEEMKRREQEFLTKPQG